MSVIREAFHKQGTKLRRGFHHGREKTVGASEIGMCARRVWYAKHGDGRDEGHVDNWGASKRGSTFESHFFVPAMRKHYGDKLILAGGKQERMISDHLSATPDGLLIDQPGNLLAGLMVPDIGPSRCVAIECKTIDPRIKLSKPKPEHVFQAQVQLGMFRKLTKYKPDYCVLAYTNASFYDDSIEFVVKFDPKVFAQAEKRAATIMGATDASECKPEGWIEGGAECEYCPYYKACARLRGDLPNRDLVATDPQFISRVADLARKEREFAEKAHKLIVQQRGVQEEIKQALRGKGLRKVLGDGMSVIWSPVKGRPSFNWVKIREAAEAVGLDIQKYETVGDPTDRLIVQYLNKDRLVK